MNNTTINTNNTINNALLVGGENTMYNVSKELQALRENGVVLNAKQIAEVRHILSTPSRYDVLDIVIDKDKNGNSVVKEQIVSLSENRLFALAQAENKMIGLYREGRTSTVLAKNFMSKFIQITFKDDEMADKAEMTSFKVYVSETTGMVFFKSRKGYDELTTGRHYSQLPVQASIYKMLLSTAGDYKVSRALFYRQDDVNETYKTIIEKVAPGFFNKMAGKLKVKEAAKKMPQMGLLKTTGKMIDYLNNFIIFNAGILDTVSGMSDGYALVNALYYMDLYNMGSEADACKISEQCRMGNSQKFTTKVAQDELFKVKSTTIFNEVIAKSVRTENANDVTEYFDANGELLMTVVGELDKATHIFDSNTTKGIVDYAYKINRGVALMAESHLSAGHLNSQVNESVVVAAALEGKMDEMESFYTDLFETELSVLVADILAAESKTPSVDDNYALSILQSVCPTNPIVFRNRYEAGVDTMKNVISGLSFKLRFDDDTNAAFNMLLSCDVAAAYGVQVVTGNNVFCAGIARKIEAMGDQYDGRFDRAIITKAPKMGVFEYKNAHFMTFEEVENTINGLDIDEDLKRMLIFNFLNAPDGVISFPSDSNEYAKLAGSDNDGDKVQAFFNDFLTNLLNKNVIVNIDTAKTTKTAGLESSTLAAKINARLGGNIDDIKYSATGEYVGKVLTVDESLIGTVYMMNVKNKMSIGLITFYNNKVVAALVEAIQGNLEPAKKFLAESGITEGYTEKKLVVDDSTVNEAFAETLRAEMAKVVWNKENIIQFLLYCNEIFRLYQEGAIDATKTGIYLDMIFKCDSLSIERLYALDTAIVKEDGDELSKLQKRIVRKNTYKAKKIDVTNIDGTKTKIDSIHFVDRIGALENKFVDVVNTEFRKILADNLDKFSYTKAQMDDFKYTLDEVNEVYPEILSELYTCKIVYNSIMVDRASRDELTQEEKDGFSTDIDNLSNTVRALIEKIDFSAYTEVEKNLTISELLLGVGCSWSVNSLDSFASNKFAYAVCPEYAYSYFVGGINYTAECNVIANGAHLDGQTVSLSRGVSEYGLLTDSRYTGEVVISDGKAYAQKAFEYKFADEKRTMIIFRQTDNMALTRNSSIVAGEDGVIYFYSDVTTDCDAIKVGKMATAKVFSGNIEEDYYVDGVSSILINTKIDGVYTDVEYTVAYLAK